MTSICAECGAIVASMPQQMKIHDKREFECENCNQNRKQLKNSKPCEFKPIPLRKDQEDATVLFQLPPDPHHLNLLGCGNDALEYMERFYPQVMSYFYKQNNLKKSIINIKITLTGQENQ